VAFALLVVCLRVLACMLVFGSESGCGVQVVVLCFVACLAKLSFCVHVSRNSDKTPKNKAKVSNTPTVLNKKQNDARWAGAGQGQLA